MRFFVEYDPKSKMWKFFDREVVKSVEGASPPLIFEASEDQFDRMVGDTLKEWKIINA